MNNIPSIECFKPYLSINGKEVGGDRLKCVQEYRCTSPENGANTLEIDIADPDMIFVDDDIYIKDVAIEFKAQMVHAGQKFSGYISAIDIDFTDTGIPQMTIHCMDSMYKMNRVKKTRTWKKIKVSQVVTNIIKKEYSYLKPHIEDTIKVEDSISQSDQTDIEFILDLASNQLQDFICYIEGNDFYFVKRKMNGVPQGTLSYKKDGCEIMNFSPQITKETKKEEVGNSNISLLTNEFKTYLANDMNVDRQLQGKPIETKGGIK